MPGRSRINVGGVWKKVRKNVGGVWKLLRGCCCAPGAMCYNPVLCENEEGPAGDFQVPAELVVALPFYFFRVLENKRYYIPAEATPVPCTNPDINIFQVFGCKPPPKCCPWAGSFDGLTSAVCCYYTGNVAKVTLNSQPGNTSPPVYYAGAYAAWLAMAPGNEVELPYLVDVDNEGRCGFNVGVEGGFFVATHGKASPTWTFAGVTYRLFVYTRPLGMASHFGYAAAEIQEYVPGIGWSYVDNLWLYLGAGIGDCCHAHISGCWGTWDGATIEQIEVTILNNLCCCKAQEPWSSGTTYGEGDTVYRGNDAYVSLAGGNTGHDPLTPGSVWWSSIGTICGETEIDNCPNDEICPPDDGGFPGGG